MNKSKPQNIEHLIASAIKEADNSYFFEDYGKQAAAVLKALKQAEITLVPVSPSEAMLQAGVAAIGSGKVRPEDHVRYVYTDMIKAGEREKSVK